MPDIVEMARKYLRKGVGEKTVKKNRVDNRYRKKNVRRKDCSAECYLELVKKSKGEKISTPSSADGKVLTVGRVLNAKIIISGKYFKGLKGVIWIGDSSGRQKEI